MYLCVCVHVYTCTMIYVRLGQVVEVGFLLSSTMWVLAAFSWWAILPALSFIHLLFFSLCVYVCCLCTSVQTHVHVLEGKVQIGMHSAIAVHLSFETGSPFHFASLLLWWITLTWKQPGGERVISSSSLPSIKKSQVGDTRQELETDLWGSTDYRLTHKLAFGLMVS